MEMDKTFLNIKAEPGATEVSVKVERPVVEHRPPTNYESDDDDIIFVGEVENSTIELNEHDDNFQAADNESQQNMELETTDFEVDEKPKCFIEAVDTRCKVVLEERICIEPFHPIRNDIEIPKLGSLGEKLMFLKQNPDISEADLIKAFYGLNCEICEIDLEFKNFEELEEHNRTEHEMESTKLFCCGVYLIKSVLSSHVKHHLGLGKWQF